MTTSEPFNPKEIFLKALELPEDQREAYLKQACPDEATRSRILSLLRHHREATAEFLADALKAVTPTPAAPTKIAEFRILHQLGAGGMGTVYLAEDTILGRKVALKVLARSLTGSEQALARFREEARSAAALKFPGIVPVYKFDRDGDTFYLVSEYVEGPTLSSLIAERRENWKLSTADARDWHRRCAEIVAAIADALESAHRANIVHRDVKPSNVLMDPHIGPRLTDFGIAKHLTEENRSENTEVVGSFHYMSPEQASIVKTRVDQRSDIFSLGVVLYEMLALRKPFDGHDTRQIIRALIECNPRRLRAVRRWIPKDLETICHKALEKDPAARYQTAAHMAADLRCFLNDRPILASPPALPRRVRQWVRAHKGASLAASGIALLALSASAVAYAWVRDDQRWRELRCCVEFAKVADGVRAYYRSYDPVTFEAGPATLVAGGGKRPEWYLPGQYRFEFVDADGRFAEVDAFLETAGHGAQIAPVFVNEERTTAAMVEIPAGTFAFREWSETGPGALRMATVDAFWIDRHEVTNREYFEFINQTGRACPNGWPNENPPAGLDRHPVVGIAWDDMQAYARWKGKRLPTVLEWEWAARCPDGRNHPWGNSEPAGLVVADENHRKLLIRGDLAASQELYSTLSRPVDSDRNTTPLGLHFMFGNAAEMTGTLTTGDRTCAVVVKGGSWMQKPETFDLTRNITMPLSAASITVGFRCARSTSPPKKNL